MGTLAKTMLGFALLATGLAVFCWWGLFTVAGQRYFDEMAGMIPMFAGLLAVVAALVVAVLAGVMLWRARRWR